MTKTKGFPSINDCFIDDGCYWFKYVIVSVLKRGKSKKFIEKYNRSGIKKFSEKKVSFYEFLFEIEVEKYFNMGLSARNYTLILLALY